MNPRLWRQGWSPLTARAVIAIAIAIAIALTMAIVGHGSSIGIDIASVTVKVLRRISELLPQTSSHEISCHISLGEMKDDPPQDQLDQH